MHFSPAVRLFWETHAEVPAIFLEEFLEKILMKLPQEFIWHLLEQMLKGLPDIFRREEILTEDSKGIAERKSLEISAKNLCVREKNLMKFWMNIIRNSGCTYWY